MLKEIEKEWELGIKELILDMEHYEAEFLGVQELAQKLRTNIEYYKTISDVNEEVLKQALEALKVFCDTKPQDFRPSREEKELHHQRVTEIMNFRLDMILSTSFDTNKDMFII